MTPRQHYIPTSSLEVTENSDEYKAIEQAVEDRLRQQRRPLVHLHGTIVAEAHPELIIIETK